MILTSVTPTEGPTLGETFVTIVGTGFNDEASGGTVEVYFNGVLSPDSGVVDSTKIIATTPGDDSGLVDVRVVNVNGAPDDQTLTGGFEYKRPDLSSYRDKRADDAIIIVTRELIRDLRRTVIENVHWDMHPEYVDAISAAESTEKHSSSPSIKLLGPTVQEDRFHSLNEAFSVETVAGSPGGARFDIFVHPVTVMLNYQYVGVGATKGEAVNLWRALTKYLARTPYLEVPQDGNDKANGVVEFEMNPVWEERAEFKRVATREGVYSFAGALTVRGVHTATADKISEGAGNDTTLLPGTLGDPVDLEIQPL